VTADGAEVAAVTRAALALAAAHGLAGVEPVLLSGAANVVLHLSPRPLVVRSPASVGLLPDAVERQRREVDLGGWLAGAGAPVVPPAGPGDGLSAGPHEVGGVWLACWRLARPVPPASVPARAVGGLLADLHAAMRGCPLRQPPLAPVDRDLRHLIGVMARRGPAPARDAERLAAVREAVVGPLLDGSATSSWQVLHGDAHPGNLMDLDGRLVWNDLEDTCQGPVEWDLGVLRSTRQADGAEAVRGYGRDPDDPALSPYVAAREVQRVAWRLALAETPAQHREALDGLTALEARPRP